MNKERRAIAGVLADLCGAYGKERRLLPPKVLMILRDAVKELADTEQRSYAKMEPFKDNPTTAANYRASVEAWEDLVAAKEALEEGEPDEAHPLLERVARPPAAVAPVPRKTPAAPIKRRRK